MHKDTLLLMIQILEEIMPKVESDSATNEYNIHKNRYPDKIPCMRVN